jgi:hypothetical protein
VDAGVNYDFEYEFDFGKKLGWEHSLLHGPAMSAMELQLCLNKGQEVVKTIAKQVVIALVLVKWE